MLLSISSGSSLFAKTKQSLEKEIKCLEIITCNPLYIMDHPDLTVSNFIENSFGLKRVKT